MGRLMLSVMMQARQRIEPENGSSRKTSRKTGQN